MKIPGRKFLFSVLVVLAASLVGACGAGSGESTSATAPAQQSADAGGDVAPAAPEAVADDGTAIRSSDVDHAAAKTRAVISKGQISLRTEDIDQARFDLQKLLDTWDGTIASEQSDADDEGRTERARLQLRVPSPRFDTAMNELGELGTLVDRSRTSEDVSTQVIDIESRIRSQRLSLARIQALLAKATDLDQVIAIEAQLSRRQADLDSLEQQQKYLADQTALATINLYLTVPDPDDEDDASGFWGGLKSGWEHLGASTSALLTGIGTALPFAAVLALIGLPLWIRRRRRATRTAPAGA